MKVAELIEALRGMDQEALVVMSRDPEGNGYGPLSDDISTDDRYEEREVGIATLTPELRERGFSEEDVWDYGVPAIVLYPEL